jgi:predicted metalloprotease
MSPSLAWFIASCIVAKSSGTVIVVCGARKKPSLVKREVKLELESPRMGLAEFEKPCGLYHASMNVLARRKANKYPAINLLNKMSPHLEIDEHDDIRFGFFETCTGLVILVDEGLSNSQGTE